MSEQGDCEECGGDAGRGECLCEDDGEVFDAGAERFADELDPGRTMCRVGPRDRSRLAGAVRRMADATPVRFAHRRGGCIGGVVTRSFDGASARPSRNVH